MGCACAIAALSYTHTQTHSSISVSRLVFKPSWKCVWMQRIRVSERLVIWWAEKKKFSSDLRFLLGDNTQEIPSNPSGLQLGTRYTVFKCQTSSLHADNEERARAPARYVNQTLLVLFKRASNFEKLHHFLAFFFLLTQKFSPWTKRQEPGTRIADAPRGER